MGIANVTEISHRAQALPPVSPVASGAAGVPAPAGPDAQAKGAAPQALHTPAAAPPPPPPPPREGFDVEVGVHEATNTKTYSFVDPDTGSTVVQIPAENVLNLVASILRQLEAEGHR
jgi:hypothetical protein